MVKGGREKEKVGPIWLLEKELPLGPIGKLEKDYTESMARTIVVWEKSPERMKERAGKLAYRANYDMKLPWGIYHPAEHEKDSTYVVMAQVDKQDVGLCVLRRATKTQYSVEVIWVEGAYRGRGLGRLLLRRASKALNAPLEEFLWLAPLSKEGRGLVKGLVDHPKCRIYTVKPYFLGLRKGKK